MAQHDYVIDNSTGANVRADINSALQAIVTNNSGSSAPSATFPFMLFADTSAGTMKIRNAADNAFIELFQLDGTFTLEDGSASTPALAFRDDLNTGIFSSAADTFNVATGGVERMELGTTTIFNEDGADVDFRIEGDTNQNLFYVDAGNDRVGIGTSSPDALLSLKGSQNSTLLHLNDSSETGHRQFTITSSDNGLTYTLNSQGSSGGVSGEIAFACQGSEVSRFDENGTFMVGSNQSRPAEFLHLDGFSIRGDVKGQVQNTVTDDTCMLLNRDGTDGQVLGFRKDGSGIGEIGVTGGEIYFQFGSTGSASHRLDDYEEGTWTATLAPTSGEFTPTTNTNNCTYTKIGRLVTVVGIAKMTTPSSLNTYNNANINHAISVSGLPFTIQNATNARSSAVIGVGVGIQFPDGVLASHGNANSSSFTVFVSKSNGGIRVSPTLTVSTDCNFHFQFSYFI